MLAAPVRVALNKAETVLDRILCVLGAVTCSQIPEFFQQYLQRLGGHVDEARLQVDHFRDAESRSGATLDELVRIAAQNPNASVAQLGRVIDAAVARLGVLVQSEAALRDASAWTRPFVFLRHVDLEIARSTWSVFRPAVPTTLEGGAYALAGMVAALGLYHGCLRPLMARVISDRGPKPTRDA